MTGPVTAEDVALIDEIEAALARANIHDYSFKGWCFCDSHFFDWLAENAQPATVVYLKALRRDVPKLIALARLSTSPALAKPVLAEVAAERARQIAKGYDAAHDDEHEDGLIAHHAAHAVYPVNRSSAWLAEGLPRREELIQGIALAVAEVERLDRLK